MLINPMLTMYAAELLRYQAGLKVKCFMVENHLTLKDTKTLDSGKTFFDISVNTDRIYMRLQADTLKKLQKYEHFMRLLNKGLV